MPGSNHIAERPLEDLSLAGVVRRLLRHAGEDPGREGLQATPDRFIAAWEYWTSGYHQDPAAVIKTFEDGAEGYDELVLARDIPIYSHCEHHLAPFWGKVHVAYLPDKKIVGLSKIPRLVEVFARRLQVQERLTNDIAKCLMEHLKPRGVAVVMHCRHMCIESRGVRVPGFVTTTSSMQGRFRSEPGLRAELLALLPKDTAI